MLATYGYIFKASRRIYKEIHSLNRAIKLAKSESGEKEAAFNHELVLQMLSCVTEYMEVC